VDAEWRTAVVRLGALRLQNMPHLWKLRPEKVFAIRCETLE
jgi:hypothetical protein